MNKYLKWFRKGYMSSRDHCFDIGTTTRNAILRYEKDNQKCYTSYERKGKNGNAPLIRLAPIPIYFHKDKEKLVEYSGLSAKTTHKNDICADCAVYYSQLIANAINGVPKEKLSDNISQKDLNDDLLKVINRVRNQELSVLPTGHILETLEVALYAFYKFDTYINGLLFVISLGEDADTVGAIYGQLAGAYYGLESIPAYYKDNLYDYEKIYKIADKLSTI